MHDRQEGETGCRVETWADAKPRTSSWRGVMSGFTLLPTEMLVQFPKACLNPSFFSSVTKERKATKKGHVRQYRLDFVFC